MELKEALMQMDTLDDEQWTKDGAPKLEVLTEAVGSKVSREDVLSVAPEFSKENMVVLPDEAPSDDDTSDEDDETEIEEEVDLSPLETYLEGDPLPEKEFAEFLVSLDPSVLTPLEQVLVQQMEAVEDALQRAQDLKNRIKRSLAFTRNRIKHVIPDMDNQTAIQEFIKSQTAARAGRYAATKEALKGVDLKTLDPRTSLEKAMARKTGRGGKRPTRGLMAR